MQEPTDDLPVGTLLLASDVRKLRFNIIGLDTELDHLYEVNLRITAGDVVELIAKRHNLQTDSLESTRYYLKKLDDYTYKVVEAVGPDEYYDE